MKRKIACKVEGRKIGDSILNLARRFKTNDLQEISEEVQNYAAAQVQVYLSKQQEGQAEALNDQTEALVAIISGLLAEKKRTLKALETFVAEMFKDTKAGDKDILTLCTQHRSKGREWNRVYLLGNNIYNPSMWARQDWQKEQEFNLEYVAITRAKLELVHVALDKKL